MTWSVHALSQEERNVKAEIIPQLDKIQTDPF